MEGKSYLKFLVFSFFKGQSLKEKLFGVFSSKMCLLKGSEILLIVAHLNWSKWVLSKRSILYMAPSSCKILEIRVPIISNFKLVIWETQLKNILFATMDKNVLLRDSSVSGGRGGILCGSWIATQLIILLLTKE